MSRFAISLVLALAVVVIGGPSSASAATPPAIRVGTSPTLSVIGAGFKPRGLVTLQLGGTDFSRRVTVHTGARGGFTHRFPSIERCAPNFVIARAPNGVGARVPVRWFVTECPPPPPLQPGAAGA